MFLGVVNGFEKAFAADHWLIPAARLNLAECLRELKRFEESEKIGLAAHEGLKQTLGPDHPPVAAAAIISRTSTAIGANPTRNSDGGQES